MTELNASAGITAFDEKETKLPTYWKTKFSKICLGMKNGHQINFVLITMRADSLYSLIADGQYRPTSLGRHKWKSLLGSSASLQRTCNKEGFNTFCTGFSYDKEPPKARIGIVSNDDYDPNCDHCRSRIGFGTAGHPDDTSSCGNVARWRADNGNKFIKVMGYILVQWYKNDPVEVLWLLPIRFFFCNKIEQTWKSIAKGHCHSSGK